MTSFPMLFSPARFGRLEIPNRICFAATSSELADRDGFIGDDMVEYYAERARGGVGLIIVEATYVEQQGKRLHHNAMLDDDRYIPGMRRIVDAVHAGGARIALQLNHGGRESIPEVSGSAPLAPSAIPSQFTGIGEAVIPKVLTVAEIARIVRHFADAAERASKAGYDAVELHGAHGYLIGTFLSPDSNQRTDDYGGDARRRARFYVELVRAIKDRLGEDFPVICRINGGDHVPGGLLLDESIEIALLLEQAGADTISVSGGVHSSRPYMVIPGMGVERGCYLRDSAAFRERLRVPVMTVGRINNPALAEEALARGEADFICLSRALIADPEFPAKAAAGEVDRIAPCIACNECISNVHRHKGLACTVNPYVTRELELRPYRSPAASPKRVVVIGAGAAGMSAATTAARRGHQVRMFEQGSRLGGQLNLAHQPPHREEIENALRYFEREVARLGVEARCNHAPTVDEIRQMAPDAIIVATGARPVTPPIPGATLPQVRTGWRVLAGLDEVEQSCVVIGGGLVGVEVTDFLASQGKTVTLIARSGLLKKAVHADRVYYQDRLAELGVEVLTQTAVLSIGPGYVEVQADGAAPRRITGVDTPIFCIGYEPRRDESVALEDLGVPVFYVGDVVGSRKFFQAIEEGTLTALKML